MLELDFNKGYIRSYQTHRVEELTTLLKHQEEKHGIKPCTYCGQFMTPRGMKRHQQSHECTSERRKYEMKQKGYEHLNVNSLTSQLKIIKERMLQFVAWDDHESILFVNREYAKAENSLLDALGVVWANSEFEASYEGPPGQPRKSKMIWVLGCFAPWHVVHFVDLLSRCVSLKRMNTTQFLLDINKFAESNQEERDSMIGMLELSLENRD